MLQMSMRQALARCLARKIRHSRRINTQSSVASLLDDNTAGSDPRNVVVNGFIRSIRKQKGLAFAAIGDGSSLEPLQAIISPEHAKSLTNGCAVRLTGSWRLSPKSAQSHELHVEEVNILGTSDPETLPLQKKFMTNDYLRYIPHMRSRIPHNTTFLRFRSEAIAAASQALAHQDFVQTHPPIITSSDCEGAGETFGVISGDGSKGLAFSRTFFRKPKYLTVSSQLHLEALAQSVGKVWALSPTFRAEKSDTARHLAEFYMLEAELPFVEDMEDVMKTVETVLKAIGGALPKSRVGKELLKIYSTDKQIELQRRWKGTQDIFHRITYTEAIHMLQSAKEDFEHKPQWGLGLQAEHEKWIANQICRDGVHDVPVFITHYPRAIKPFYMLPTANCEEGRETVDCFDLIVPEACEIVGGSMREHRLDPLFKAMQSKGLIPPELSSANIGKAWDFEINWYVDLRRWGSVPHGGFGLGFDRLLGYLAGVNNIREMVTFPRWVGRCDC